MPDLKISQMPEADALAGTEAMPVVQGGENRRSTPAAIKSYIGDAVPTGEGQNDGLMTHEDKAKLDGIESGATADQTAQEIATLIDADATAETTLKSALGLGSAAYTASTDYAVAAKGVTNGDSHDHSGGDGAQIAYSSLSGTPTLPSGAIVGTTDQQTLSAKTLTGLKETKVAVSAAEINLATGNWFTKTISTTTAFTVTNVPSSGTAVSFILDLTNGGSATVSWSTGFTSVKYAGGSAPTLTASGRDVLGFFTHDGGSTWTCLLLAKDVK